MLFFEGEVEAWVRAFVFTQAIEVPIYVAAMGLPLFESRRPLWQRCAIAFLCSLVTHPFVWFLFPRLIPGYENYPYMVLAAETFAVVVEALILWGFGVRRALMLSFLVNMTSMSLGFLLRTLFGWV